MRSGRGLTGLDAPAETAPMFRAVASTLVLALSACAGDVSEADTDRGSSGGSSGPGPDGTSAPAPLDDGGTTAGGADGSSSDAVDETTGEPLLGAPYPVVLAHGFFGFEDFAGVDFVTYYFGVLDDLAAEGETMVFTPAVDPFNDSTVRGMQLLAAVEEIVAETGHAKVNLIGHSQGGLDARMVAHLRPDLVASVTTVATPHHGTVIADVVLGLVPNAAAQGLADDLANLLGGALWSELGPDSSVFVALEQLSTPGIAAFNAMVPDAPGVAYRSIGGRSSLHGGGSACDVADAPPYIAALDGDLDTIDGGLALSAAILSEDLLTPAPNDGLVTVASATWGTFLGCIPADHLDEVGQLLGDAPGLGNDLDHRAVYRGIVAELRQMGL
jgi:triacylglycerol lipase